MHQAPPTVDVSFRFLLTPGQSAAGGRVVDVTVPLEVPLAELFDEVVALAGVELGPEAWELTTAAGSVIDPSLPVAATPLSNGDCIVVSPQGMRPTPRLLDAAEAAASLRRTAVPAGLPAACAAAGFIAGGVLVAREGHWWGWWLLAAVALTVVARRPKTAPSVWAVCGLSGAFSAAWGSWCFALEGHEGPITGTAGATAAAGACATAAAVAAVIWLIGAPPQVGVLRRLLPGQDDISAPHHPTVVIVASGITAAAVVGVVASGAWWLNQSVPAVGAGLVLAALLLQAAAPRLAQWAGALSVPPIPAVEDSTPDDELVVATTAQAARAQHTLAGVMLGAAITGAVGCLLSGSAPLCALVIPATAAHALRHRDGLCLWALWAWAGAAIIGTAQAPAWAILAVAAVTVPLWAHKAGDISPTGLKWVERAEIAALALCLPVALHLVGVFARIRGWG